MGSLARFTYRKKYPWFYFERLKREVENVLVHSITTFVPGFRESCLPHPTFSALSATISNSRGENGEKIMQSNSEEQREKATDTSPNISPEQTRPVGDLWKKKKGSPLDQWLNPPWYVHAPCTCNYNLSNGSRGGPEEPKDFDSWAASGLEVTEGFPLVSPGYCLLIKDTHSLKSAFSSWEKFFFLSLLGVRRNTKFNVSEREGPFFCVSDKPPWKSRNPASVGCGEEIALTSTEYQDIIDQDRLLQPPLNVGWCEGFWKTVVQK